MIVTIPRCWPNVTVKPGDGAEPSLAEQPIRARARIAAPRGKRAFQGTVMPTTPMFAADLAKELPPADFLRVLLLFRADMVRLTGEAEAAARAGGHEALRRAAHGLAGAAGAVGATAVDTACRIIMRSKDADLDLAESIQTIRRLAEATIVDLDLAISQARTG